MTKTPEMAKVTHEAHVGRKTWNWLWDMTLRHLQDTEVGLRLEFRRKDETGRKLTLGSPQCAGVFKGGSLHGGPGGVKAGRGSQGRGHKGGVGWGRWWGGSRKLCLETGVQAAGRWGVCSSGEERESTEHLPCGGWPRRARGSLWQSQRGCRSPALLEG